MVRSAPEEATIVYGTDTLRVDEEHSCYRFRMQDHLCIR
jgi:hypothetical protein